LVFLNPSPAPKDGEDAKGEKRTLFVQYFEFEGPADTLPPTHKKIMARKDGLSVRDGLPEILERFASKAYRRPATKAEVDRLLNLVHQAEKNGEKTEAGVQLAMQAVLCSPK